MASLCTREEAHARLLSMFKSALERVIPLNRDMNMRGGNFMDFENLVDECFHPVLAAVLEERAKVDWVASIEPDRLGRCPACGSNRLYLRPECQQEEILSTHGPVVLQIQHARCRACDLSFSLQGREWHLPSEAALSPKALRRIAREATLQSFDKAACAINEDWSMQVDGKQIQRWAGRAGARMVADRERAQAEFEAGRFDIQRLQGMELLVVEVDGGRVQTCEKNPETGSRWREDKVAAVTTYLPGDGKERAPEPLVTTHMATMQKAEEFGRMVRVEAERRGFHYAARTILLGDGGNWLDPLFEREFPNCPRIVDWYHAVEHLYECAKAIHGPEEPQTYALAETWKESLWNGQVRQIIDELQTQARQLPRNRIPERQVLETNVGYFERHQAHMNYPEYRSKGWPIGSGGVEAAVKQFNKRVKGTEQFWQEDGVEAILALRANWLSQDGRWDRYWACRPAYSSN